MKPPATDVAFTNAVAEIYETLFVPLLFEPYAVDLARRVERLGASRVLELAAGTGAVTRILARDLPASVEIVATDLNPSMIEKAAAVGTARAVTWRSADAMQLPFPDASFDLVVCQFGAMFFPDKARAFAETRRVLRDGGRFLFSVWDRLEDNELAETVTDALAHVFTSDPPRFMARVPHGYFDIATIRADLAGGGFTRDASIDTVTLRSRAASARDAAMAYCQGSPMRGEITARDPARLEEATVAAERAITSKFGTGAIDAKMQAHVILAVRSFADTLK